jgi:hypothetical protein
MSYVGRKLPFDANRHVVQGPVGFRIEDGTVTPYAKRSPISVTSATAVKLVIPSDAESIQINSSQIVYLSTESNVATTAGMKLNASTDYKIPLMGVTSDGIYLIANSTTAVVSFAFNTLSETMLQRNSWNFNGTTQYVTMPDTLAIPPTSGAFAISFWIKPLSVTATTKTLFLFGNGSTNGIKIEQVDATIRFTTYEAGPASEVSVSEAAILAAGTWAFISISLAADGGSGQSVVIRVNNGATTNSTDAGDHTIVVPTTGRYIGKSGTTFFNGKLAQIRIFTTALNSTDSDLLYAFEEAATATLQCKFLCREVMVYGGASPTDAVESVAAINGTIVAGAYGFFDPEIA